MELLEAHEVDSDIYNDFRDRLKQLEHSESQFSHKKFVDWNGSDWKGFYQALGKKRKVVNWNYVNNQAGGFWNAVLNWTEHNGIYPYMQIEQGPLCFKVGDVHDNRRDVREHFHHLLMSNAPEDIELKRSGRLAMELT